MDIPTRNRARQKNRDLICVNSVINRLFQKRLFRKYTRPSFHVAMVVLMLVGMGVAAGWLTRGACREGGSAGQGDIMVFDRLDRHYPGPCVGYVDGDGDEPVDGIIDSRWVYFYDGARQLMREEDYGPDGTTDAILTFVYDSASELVGERYDCDADDIADEVFTYIFDSQGRKRMALIEKARGHAVACLGPEHFPLNLENEFDDEHGLEKPIMQRRYDWSKMLRDLGVEDVRNIVRLGGLVQYSYDDTDQPITEEWDLNGNGTVEEIIHFVYDSNGNLMLEYHDDGLDGIIDVLVRYDYGCWR